jgi:hypothetical protein
MKEGLLRSHLQKNQVLFIGGIIGEILASKNIGDYFSPNIEALEQYERYSQCSRFMPSSLNSSHDNAYLLKEKIVELVEDRQKPVILFCHSRACLEAILCLSRYPWLMQQGLISQIVLLQGCLGGSKIVEKLYQTPLRRLLNQWPGLKSLLPGIHSDEIDSWLNCLDEEMTNELKKRLFVIATSKRDSNEVSWILRPTHKLLSQICGDNDGLLPISSQTHPKLPCHQQWLEADHADFVTGSRLSRLTPKQREDFTLDIFTLLAETSISAHLTVSYA